MGCLGYGGLVRGVVGVMGVVRGWVISGES